MTESLLEIIVAVMRDIFWFHFIGLKTKVFVFVHEMFQEHVNILVPCQVHIYQVLIK